MVDPFSLVAGLWTAAQAVAPSWTAVGMATGYFLMGQQQRRGQMDVAIRQEARQREELSFRLDLSDRQHSQSIERADRQHAQAIERAEHMQRVAARREYTPLRVTEAEIEAMVPDDRTLRFFLAFPRHLVLRGDTADRVWTDFYSDSLESQIKRFVQRHYDIGGARPAFVFERSVMNPEGLRGSAAVPFLQDGLRARPTVYLECYRRDLGSCEFAMSHWTDKTARAVHRSVGAVDSYDIAAHAARRQSMARSVLFQRQLDGLGENEKLRQILARERAKGASSPLHDLFLGAERVTLQEELARTGLPADAFGMPPPDPNRLDVMQAAVSHLGTAYLMLIALMVDLHYLPGGTAPLMPRLIEDREFDLTDADRRVAMREMLGHYVWAAAKIALERPGLAPDLYVALAESFVSFGPPDWCEGFVLEAGRSISKLAQGPEVGSLDDLPHALARLRPGTVTLDWRQRVGTLLARLGRNDLEAALTAAPGAIPLPDAAEAAARLRRLAYRASRGLDRSGRA